MNGYVLPILAPYHAAEIHAATVKHDWFVLDFLRVKIFLVLNTNSI